MILHLMTSSKGGVGKTLCALCASIKHIEDGGNFVLALDMNWVNPDIKELLRLGKRLVPLDSRSKFVGTQIQNEQSAIIAPGYSYALPMEASGFWDNIKNAIGVCRKEYFHPTHVIVDTCLHMANLIKSTHPNSAQATIRRITNIAQAPDIEIERIYIWFIWTLNEMRGENIQPIQKSIDYLMNIDGLGNKIQILNVLNPHALYPRPTLDRLYRDKINSIRHEPMIRKFTDLQNLAESGQIVSSVSFSDLYSTFQEFTDDSMTTVVTNRHKLDMVAEKILEDYHGRPKNVLPISLFTSDLVGYTDSTYKPYQLSELKNQLGEVYEDIRRYLRVL